MGDRQMLPLVSAMQGKFSPENKKQFANGIDGRKAMELVIGACKSTEEGIMVRPEEIS